jgi:hypothetical protein
VAVVVVVVVVVGSAADPAPLPALQLAETRSTGPRIHAALLLTQSTIST